MSGDGGPSGAHYGGQSVGGGRYVLRDLLGRGGMAAVHLAHDTVLDRPVAVKTLHSELGREQSFRERFRREAQAVAKLNHTNIVSVFDSGEDTIDGSVVPYIVMEYVEGKPLRTVLDEDIARHGAMPTEKALKITADVLAALSESHSMGLVHRDIKPGNVMLTRRGVVKVMDFGIARAMQSGVTSVTQTGMVVGTPQYLSPEQALGRGVDERSDLYSVGCMLFELLTGRLPFDGDSPLAIAYQHVQEIPSAPSVFNRAVSPAADALVAWALKKNPQERFPTADTMREEAERVAAAERGAPTVPLMTGAPDHRGRGEGVASAVFPPVDASLRTPPPDVRQPYQAPYGPQRTGHPGFGPSAPASPVPQPAYGYPQQQTPPPYTLRSQGAPSGGGGGRSGGLSGAAIAVGSTLAVVAVVLVVIVAIAMNRHNGSGGSGGTDVANSGPTVSAAETAGQAAADPSSSIVEGDPSRTVDTSKCTDLTRSFTETDKNKYLFPDLTTKYVDSVKECMKAAGWSYTLKTQDEALYGKGTVMRTHPKALDSFDPRKDKVTLWVSTGKSY
jgi:serine/threonine protein kinase